MRGVSIDMADPAVAGVLGNGVHHVDRFKVGKRELVQLAGDDGLAQTIGLTDGKQEARVTYKDMVLTVDVYVLPKEPIQVHLICPKCRQQLRVSQERKHIDWNPATGELSIEPFQCTWEMPDAGDHTPGLRFGGTANLCRLKLGIHKNVAKDA